MFLFSLQLLSEALLILRRIQWNTITNIHSNLCKVGLPFNVVRFSTGFQKTKTSNFIKILQTGAELFHADGQTDGQTDIMKLKVAFGTFANSIKTDRWTDRKHALNLKVLTKECLLTKKYMFNFFVI